jgi:trimeric autotransporter adhesin
MGLTAFGYHSGMHRPGNSVCTFIGYDSDNKTANNLSNANAFGYQSRVTAANTCRIGNSVMGSIGGFDNWSNVSDGRFKKNVTENVKGLEFINLLRPVTYNLDVTGLKKFMKEEDSENMPASIKKEMQEAVAEKEKQIKTGFISQEVEAAAKESGFDFSGVDKPQNDESLYGLRYAEFTVPLVKAVQELSKLNDAKEEKLNTLTSQVEELKTQVASLQSAIANSKSAMTTDGMVRVSTSEEAAIALLGQNLPNPFDNSTIIPFRIPKECHSATIIITEATGKIIRAIPVSCRETQLALEAGALIPGSYSYSLIVDNVTMDTKQMILVK